MKPIVLIGGGGHCRACIDVVNAEGKYEVMGLVVQRNNEDRISCELPVLGSDDNLREILDKYKNALVSVGQIKSSEVRQTLYRLVKNYSGVLPVVRSPFSYASRSATIGEGSVIMHGAVLNAHSSIGVNCIINCQALIEHDVIVGDHCHISTGVKLNGGVGIGSGTFVGSGAVIKEGVQIGKNVVIGAGKTILKNVDQNVMLR